ncbi:MAG: clostripain-related cysteine peptidase [Rikenellaceae bacterium]
MRRFLYIIVALSTLVASCSKEEEGDLYSASQTTLMYFMGTHLKSYYNSNISDIEEAIVNGALGKNGAFYYCLPDTSGGATLYQVIKSGNECESIEIKNYETFESISRGSITMVIEEVKSVANLPEDEPLHQMNLIIGSHGMGWVLTDEDDTTSSQLVAGKKSTTNIDVEEFQSYLSNQDVVTRYLGLSNTTTTGANEGWMNIEDFRLAIEDSNTRFGYIIFDACLMSSIEVYYRLRNCSDYIVASPCEIMGKGFPYDSVVPFLFTNDGENYDLVGVCEAYYNYYAYSTEVSKNSGAIAMCVTSELKKLALIVGGLHLREATSSELANIQCYERYTNHLFFDLGEYITTFGDGDTEALAIFEEQFDLAFPEECRLHTPTFYSNLGGSGTSDINYYSGVTTSEPSSNTYSSGWELEPWAIDASRTSEAN